MEVSASQQRRRLRSACDVCHASKVRCSGGQPCKKCCNSNLSCTYSYMAKLGKPKGSRNKRTLERLGLAIAGGANSTINACIQTSANNAFQGDWPVMLNTHQGQQEKDMPATTIPPSSDANASLPTILSITAPSCTACTPVINDPTPDLSMELSSILDFEIPLFYSSQSPTDKDPQFMPDFLDLLFTSNPNTDILSNGPDSDSGVGRRSRIGSYEVAANGSPPSLMQPNNSNSNSNSPNSPREVHKRPKQFSPIRSEQRQAASSLSNCICLKMLTGMQCSLSGIERKQGNRRLDIILSMATMILDCSSRALACDPCWLDSQVLFLIMVLLQTVFNWAIINCNNARSRDAHKPPSINFGTWNVSEEEGTAVKLLLVNRIMAKSKSTVNIVRQRIDSISSTEAESRYQPIDSQILYVTLKRVADALAEVRRHGKEMGTCYDGDSTI
ncbi:Zn(2)-C6 fungal-type domain-containing protein [Trichoderma simmonsii]|uniref:Zn(2)-C6 fungal-type domain-containing protein n=1 Tax=Trichoderma simmonsii TaxID=1491479 RepID=A0A8G0L3M9_9HYPO|nr:Zn(2)-C6 fungal-type domain-containing protein [Trichoderma simmonsii]